MVEITMGMALLQLTSQPSGVDYPEKKIIWPESNTGEPPTWEEVEAKRQELIDEEPMKKLRQRRNKLLKETDYLALKDVFMTTDEELYRQQLRDITKGAKPKLDEHGNLTNITWPVRPK